MNASADTAAETPGIVRALSVLRERWWIVLIAAATCVGISLALTMHETKQYTATAKLHFSANPLITEVGASSPPTSADPQADQATNLLLVTTSQVADAVRAALGQRMSTSDLLSEVTATNDQSSNIVDVSATDPSPARAAQIANGFADQYVATSKRANVQQVLNSEQVITRQLDALPPTPSNPAGRANLQASLQRLVLLAAVQTGDAEVVDRAGVPTSPSSPNTKVNLIVALVFGLALGIGLAFLLNLLDRRLKAVEEFESAYNLRAIGSLPRTPRQRPVTSPESVESFRILRSALGYLAANSELRTVLVTSAVSGEGKTTVASGLAHAAALAGQRVVLVEADLRRPTFSKHFDLSADIRGLTSALVGTAAPEELLQTPVDGVPTLQVLPSGPFSPHPTDLLSSAEMTVVLADLARDADLVVIDSLPLLPVADAQVLLEQPMIDATLIIGRTYMTTRDQARQCRAVLERQRVTNAALVVVGGHEPADYAYGLASNGRGRTEVAAD